MRVLIVEDSEDDTTLLVRELRRGGYEVTFQRVETAQELRKALDGSSSWDVVIADYNLPCFSAPAALTLLQESRLDLPFLVVSGTIGEETAAALMKAGAHDYFMKSNLARLIPAIERELKEAEVRQERRKAEEALRRSEGKYRTLVENANDAILIVQDEVIKFSNSRTMEILGYSEAELAKIPFTEHIHPEDRGTVLEGYQKRLRGEKLGALYSFRVQNKSGEVLWAELNVVLIEWEGRPATLNFVRDVTEHKKLEEQFLQAQKMEAIGQLAGGFAHDFNNSITLIKVCSQLALLELKEEDPLREKLEMIHQATQRSANLANQLLAFSRRQIMEMKVFDPNDLLRDLHKMLRRVIGDDIELINHLADDLGRVKADPALVEQVVINLVVNSRDAMPTGGRLTIETANVEFDRLSARDRVNGNPGAYVMLAVSDTGVGMTPAVKERIFEPFFTTKEKGRGTGLGLSTVYGIVRQSGGNIRVDSEPGKGAMFKIYFPRVDEPLEEPEKRLAAERPPCGDETILLVEDEKNLRRVTAEILRRQGYRVLEGTDAGEAMPVIDQYRGTIHLLLADLIMPGMNGRELANLLLGKHPAMKVLLMSGYADHELLQGIQGGKWAPVFHYIQKPFSLEGLALKVRKILDRRIKVPQSRDAKSIKLASNNPLPTNVRQAGKR